MPDPRKYQKLLNWNKKGDQSYHTFCALYLYTIGDDNKFLGFLRIDMRSQFAAEEAKNENVEKRGVVASFLA